jgi:hypothetical protein
VGEPEDLQLEETSVEHRDTKHDEHSADGDCHSRRLLALK